MKTQKNILKIRNLILGLSIGLLLSFAANAGTKGILVPSPKFPTIQSAINATPFSGNIILMAGTYTETIVVANKTIAIEGQGDSLTNIQNNLTSVPTFEVRGSGNLKLKNLKINGSAIGIHIIEDSGFKPDVRLEQVSILQTIRGINGTPNSLQVILSSISSSTQSGITLINPNHVYIDESFLSNNLGSGLRIYGSGSSANPTVYINGTVISGNSNNGIYIQNSAAEVYMTQLEFDQNYSAHLLLNNASNVSLLKSTLNNALTNAYGVGDGIRLFHSNVYLDHNNITNSGKTGLAVYGCPNEAVSAVTIRDTHTSNSLSTNWVSGALDFCADKTPTNWIQQLPGNICDLTKLGTCEPTFEVLINLGSP